MKKFEIPPLGLGTWQMKGQNCRQSVLAALEMGYRLIDTAQLYGNEDVIGKAIQDSGIPREDIILATKISIFKIHPWILRRSFKKSLKKLRTDYVDILYVHWPGSFYKPHKTMPIFNELYEEGMIRAIGVSNFTIENLRNAKEYSKYSIFVNQVEHHPLLPQEKLREYMKQENIHLVAYSPLARGIVMEIPQLSKIANNHNVSEAQVSLAWIRQHGGIPIPKASSLIHLKDNWQSQELELSPGEIQQIDNIKQRKRLLNPPFISPNWDK